jgi:hypothetical protein
MAIKRKLQKKHSRFFSERIHAPADSFISKNEGMNEGADGCSRAGGRHLSRRTGASAQLAYVPRLL